MKLGRWSTTAGNNNSSPPDGLPEGQTAASFNDCMREMMASVRTVFQDPQFFDADLTPTFVDATNFTLSGNQTSAVHSGRRLKIEDYTTIYATVVTASFTALTTITIAPDSGSLTAFLSSFALSIFSKNNTALPQDLSLSAKAVNVSGNVTASSGSIQSLSLSATATYIPKAGCRFYWNGAAIVIQYSFGVSSISRSVTGSYRINFTNPFVDTNYCFSNGRIAGFSSQEQVRAVGSYKWHYVIPGVASIDHSTARPANIVFIR